MKVPRERRLGRIYIHDECTYFASVDDDQLICEMYRDDDFYKLKFEIK